MLKLSNFTLFLNVTRRPYKRLRLLSQPQKLPHQPSHLIIHKTRTWSIIGQYVGHFKEESDTRKLESSLN